MKPLATLAAAFLAACAMAGAAPAQIAPSMSGSSTLSYLGADQFWGVVSEFGTCYAQTNRVSALTLIATAPNSREEAETYRKLFGKAYNSCLGDVTELHGVTIGMMRGAIAEGLYRKRVPLPAELMQTPPAREQIRNLSQAALCYTAGHAADARNLVLGTRPGSRKEYEAVVALMPEFGRCIPAGAKNVSFDVTQIRFRIAEALLRTGVPAVLPAPTTTK